MISNQIHESFPLTNVPAATTPICSAELPILPACTTFEKMRGVVLFRP